MNVKFCVFAALLIAGVTATQGNEQMEGVLARFFEQLTRQRRQEIPQSPAAASAPGTASESLSNKAEAGSSSDPMKPTSPMPMESVQSFQDAKFNRINSGVSTIVGGATGGGLEQILRGSFMIPHSDRVRTVANGVLDSIFGHHKPAGA